MKVNRAGYWALFCMLFCLSTTLKATPILSFNNSGSDIIETVTLGDSVNLDLWISGLDADNLGGFDINMGFDNSILSLTNAVLDPLLTEFDFLSISPSAANVELSGVSLFGDLSAQADAFRLASFSFDTAAIGSGIIEISSALLSDELALPLAFDNFTATINVNDLVTTPPSIPEPTTWLLLIAGLGLAGRNALLRA
ncbi:PEP-CTERM sorting domain-containing protein [Thalassotalea euphylliae]|uniref:PEP-CTERM sorting domain-containing protein n=1 Tax=Thalassotalea euphylliae TaxID=1655234 RepID=A0A3E0TVP1_9GAMM|nr:PEP-CTERM sorting domain-containing protein [Thalassotalea euphylliae]REL28510.1 PEP-CTERM sorting domain-containing protein [Thalassotalea euphylliae]